MHPIGPLPDGDHTFSVRAIDQAGNVDPTPATRTFSVRTTAPDTSIDSGPQVVTNDSTPTLTFSSTALDFECQLDGAPFAPCTSPYKAPGLQDGQHTFSVRAKDPAGNLDPTPATSTFSIDTTPPDTAIDSGPAPQVHSRLAHVHHARHRARHDRLCPRRRALRRRVRRSTRAR